MDDLLLITGLDLADEVFQTLHTAGGATVERIVSNGQVTAWFEQEHDEWVVLLRGKATLEYADGSRDTLSEGHSMTIPAGRRHRVIQSAPATIWVAVHFPVQA